MSSAERGPRHGQRSNGASTRNVASDFEHIRQLSKRMGAHLDTALKEVDLINTETRILSLNAKIVAAHSDAASRTFGAVATEMARVSSRTAGVAKQLNEEVHSDLNQLDRIVHDLGRNINDLDANIRGTRLADLAHVNIELIDRNLYERSCDVRWWATDASVVDALTHRNAQTTGHASARLGTILDSYTVYYDIVLCDLQGTVIANGRPAQYPSQGSSQANTAWFQQALATVSGTQFGFQSAHRSPTLAGGNLVLVYSCAVRENGSATGRPLGVLGIVFNWEGLGQAVVNNTQLNEGDHDSTRICIVDSNGTLLADTQGRMLDEPLDYNLRWILAERKKGFRIIAHNGDECTLAHAFSPGYETYATGWHSMILQRQSRA